MVFLAGISFAYLEVGRLSEMKPKLNPPIPSQSAALRAWAWDLAWGSEMVLPEYR